MSCMWSGVILSQFFNVGTGRTMLGRMVSFNHSQYQNVNRFSLIHYNSKLEMFCLFPLERHIMQSDDNACSCATAHKTSLHSLIRGMVHLGNLLSNTLQMSNPFHNCFIGWPMTTPSNRHDIRTRMAKRLSAMRSLMYCIAAYFAGTARLVLGWRNQFPPVSMVHVYVLQMAT